MANPDVSPPHLSWIVDGRSANQASTMQLYKLIYENDVKLNANAEYHKAAQELAGIAFSLWRAVFLSDTTGQFEDQTADLKRFLVSLISDNAVIYNTDKNSRNWSFRYYLANANHRLRDLASDRLGLVSNEEIAKPADSEKGEWLLAQGMLNTAVERFGMLLQA